MCLWIWRDWFGQLLCVKNSEALLVGCICWVAVLSLWQYTVQLHLQVLWLQCRKALCTKWTQRKVTPTRHYKLKNIKCMQFSVSSRWKPNFEKKIIVFWPTGLESQYSFQFKMAATACKHSIWRVIDSEPEPAMHFSNLSFNFWRKDLVKTQNISKNCFRKTYYHVSLCHRLLVINRYPT